jgi:hypothetical protein
MIRGLLLFLLTLPFIAFGQDKIDFKQGIVLQSQFCDTIPFEYVRNKMIVEVKINGEKKRFIFDTGATLCISDEIQEKMKNPILGKNFQIDATQRQKQISVVSVKEFQLGNLTFQNIPSVVTNIKNTSFLTCFNYDGFIGSNVVRNCIVHIDVDKKYIILTDNINKLNLQNAHQTILTLDNQSGPYLEINLKDKIKFKALFDSGADDFITISNKISKKALKKDVAKILNQGFGIGTLGMHGLGDAEHKNRTKFSNVIFGSSEITDFITEVSDKSYNAVGMQLADYGTITVDYINKYFYFVAKQQSQAYKQQKTMGFSFQPEETYYSIGTVWTGTQAEKIGLKSGYQILRLDDLDITKRTPELDCKLFLSRPLSNGKIKITYKDDKDQIKMAELTE